MTGDAFALFRRSPRRPRRSHEWSAARIVTFVVTLAASGGVTLAAARAGMSRKSAYSLRGRDPAFACLWDEAIAANRQARMDAVSAKGSGRTKGDKADKTDKPPKPNASGDNWRGSRGWADAERDLFFCALRESRPTVPTA